MCGLAGFLAPSRLAITPARRAVAAMTDAIRYRGPDAEGIWLDEEAGLAFGHRRLSILDLSPAGAQPMVSRCGRYVIAYNGETYNFSGLKLALEQDGLVLRGHSDTEIILESFVRWGVSTVLPRLAGMFAFALWDRHEKILTLARDHLGIKPLYWAQATDGTFLFGSELKALRAHPSWGFAIEPQAVACLLSSGYIPSPMAIYRGVHKLAAGQVLTLKLGEQPHLASFWSLSTIARRGQDSPLSASDGSAADALDGLLRQIVGEHLVSDVPVGAFLSGGIDSSVVVALMRQVSQAPVRTFTIGYGEATFDESAHAREVAAHLGTEHVELRVSSTDVLAVVPNLPEMFDEPFADSSQIPTYLVSRLARQQVSVALSGDGGDEMFAGYNRHVWVDRLHARTRHLPGPLRRLLACGLSVVSVDTWDGLAAKFPGLPRMAGSKAHKLAAVLRADATDVEGLYGALVTFWPEAHRLVMGASPQASHSIFAGFGAVEAVQLMDGLGYLPDDILVKADRASMAVSLEMRVPLLDRRLAEFAWRLPRHQRLRGGQGKWLLRQVLYRYVPRPLVERPKMGFAVPLAVWLRGPLREWAEDLLSLSSLNEHELFNPDPIRCRWQDCLNGRGGWEHHLWNVLMFQAWWRRWR